MILDTFNFSINFTLELIDKIREQLQVRLIQKEVSPQELSPEEMKSQRHQYNHQKRLIYEWQQSLDSLTLFVQCPPIPQNIKKSSIFDIKITSSHLNIGIKGNPPYLSHDFKSIADSQQSLWYIGENPITKKAQLVVDIQKAQKGVRWGAVFKQHQTLNPLEEQTLKKKLMLERFQEQHPGFDFTDAEFNGQVPQARTFMGGLH